MCREATAERTAESRGEPAGQRPVVAVNRRLQQKCLSIIAGQAGDGMNAAAIDNAAQSTMDSTGLAQGTAEGGGILIVRPSPVWEFLVVIQMKRRKA